MADFVDTYTRWHHRIVCLQQTASGEEYSAAPFLAGAVHFHPPHTTTWSWIWWEAGGLGSRIALSEAAQVPGGSTITSIPAATMPQSPAPA